MNNICIDCWKAKETPYWFMTYDNNLTGWRSYLCIYCACIRDFKSPSKVWTITCGNCGYEDSIEKVIEHTLNHCYT